jgi:hypothetical protein
MEAGSDPPYKCLVYVQGPFDSSINMQQESTTYWPEKDENFVLFLNYKYFYVYLYAIDDVVHMIIMSCWFMY